MHDIPANTEAAASASARKREAALRDILQVISTSRDDEKPVFDVILHRAADLCGAHAAGLVMGKAGDRVQRLVGQYGMGPGSIAVYDRGEVSMNPDISMAARAILTGKVVHIPDMIDTDGYRNGVSHYVSAVRDTGVRTNLFVPLLAPGGGIGCFIIFRTEVRPYSADEIALVETFAAQAVIAIENVQQFRELQTRLAREAATREILEVISRSRDDERPVFDVVLRKAAELCGASMASLIHVSEDRSHAVAVAEWGDHVADQRPVGVTAWPMESAHAPSTCLREGRIVHIPDLADTDLYRSGDAIRVTAADVEGIRTFLSVPLFIGGKTVSCISIFRREVRPFSADEITLVETFAAQAVIAIENVRQFRAIQTANAELQTRLAREAATREILEVISQSRDDDRPVFDAILQNATQLCGADSAALLLGTPEGPHLALAALWAWDSLPTDAVDAFIADINRVPMLMDPSLHISARAICSGGVVHIHDLAQTEAYLSGETSFRFMVEDQGVRTTLSVPIFDGHGPIGCISVHRNAVRPYSDDEISLIEGFAAQAVIAIENVRQFRELQTRLEREKASAEILEVISRSRDDEAPVFEVILQSIAGLCRTSLATLNRIDRDGTHLEYAAHLGVEFKTFDLGRDRWPLESTLQIAQSVREARTIHTPDLSDTDLYRSGDPFRVRVVDEEGVRSYLTVPLITADRQAIGCIGLYRQRLEPFTSDQIALIETFAAQAVIAIENVRQFRELQTRLAREAATREILEVISQSRDDDKPVFDAVLRNANRLCGTSMAYLALGRPDDTVMTLAAYVNPHLPSQDAVDQIITFANQTAMRMDAAEHFSAKAILSGEVVQIADIATTPGYLSGEPTTRILVEDVGVRTILSVPMFDAQSAIGAISLQRREERLFSDDEITLIQSFAAQAVIAIENVRQFRELQARLAREAATRDILEVISQSRDDDTPVFDMIAQNAARLCRADVCSFWRVEDGLIHYCASHGLDGAASAEASLTPSIPLLDNTLTGQVVKTRAVARIDDAMAESYYNHEWARAQGVKQMIGVPIFAGGDVWGSISLMWRVDQANRDADIQLVESFAAQAAIAIENVRQFKALEALNAELGERVQDQVGEIERMGRLKRFLPAAVADTVISTGSEKMLSSHRALLGVLFCDIRGFTAFCETAEPEETIEVLQTYHEEMGRLIEAHGAGVDHRMGDGIMVLFNDPIPCDDPAGQAVRLGLAMRDRMAELCKGWKKLGHKLGFGVGVSLGYATVGMVGSGGRIDYTASGTAINLASRLSDEAQDGEILLSPRARLAVEDDVAVEPRGEITLKGMREPVEVYRVMGMT